ncbi:hypothetical protein ACP275_13G083100 [Erythranthe tilingii]
MATTEQRRRKRRKREKIDRISDLPDSVICHILSYLPTKSSVRTSVLGQRWRFLWTYVPILDFDREKKEFVNGVISLHKMQTISTFRLLLRKKHYDKHQHVAWVTAAVNRNVRNLYLVSLSDYYMPLPQHLFTCKTLVGLVLNSCHVTLPSCPVYLPRLEKLHLISVRFEADDELPLPRLLSGCPVLEELEIECSLNFFTFSVSSPTLKRLRIDLEVGGGDDDDVTNLLELNTPSLTYLQLGNCFFRNIKSGAMTSLIEADISLCSYEAEDEEEFFVYSRLRLEFIDRLCNVKSLELDLSQFTRRIVDSVLSAWSWTMSFHNLTKLELTGACRFLPKFLESAENLEILIFTEFYEKSESWTEPLQVPKCLLSHLRIIKIARIRGKKHEFEYIRYLLTNALALERMEVAYLRLLDSEGSSNMLDEISRLRRGSNACEVAFVHSPY